MAVFDNSRTVNMAGLDEMVGNERTRCTLTTPLGVNWLVGIGTPTSLTPGATQTLTFAQMSPGIVVIAPSTGNTTTFDTAANIVAGFNNNSAGAVVGDILPVLIVNGSGTSSITIAAGSGGGFDTNQNNKAIAANTSRYVYIRLTNVTSGSEAYVIYF